MWRTMVDLLLTLVGSGRRVWRLQLVFFAIVLGTALTIASAGLSPPQVLRGVLLGGLILALGTRTYGLEAWEHLTLAAPMAAMFLALAAEPPIDLWEYALFLVGLGLYWAGAGLADRTGSVR